MNKYLEKVAGRMKSKHYHKAKEIIQGELIEHAMDKAKEYHHKRKKGHEKLAIALVLYKNPKTGKTKWVVGDNPPPEGWVVEKKSYKKFDKKA